MQDRAVRAADDRVTMIAISALAYILADVLHESVGHGLTAWLSGAHRITLSTVGEQANVENHWIVANGTLVNLVFAAIFWLLLTRRSHHKPAVRYFLMLGMAGKLLTGTGYFFFSRVTNFGDWAQLIRGFEPHWLWRAGLVVVGAASYYASTLLLASQMRPFRDLDGTFSRIRRLCWTPYWTDAVLAAAGAVFNPAGLFYVIASTLPSTLGANAGMLALPGMLPQESSGIDPVAPIQRSVAWIGLSGVIGLCFVFIWGRGLTWSR